MNKSGKEKAEEEGKKGRRRMREEMDEEKRFR